MVPIDARWVELASRVMSAQAAWHRLDVRGMERVPHGAALLVGNHNGGANAVDGLFLIKWYRERGMSEPVYVLAHSFFFDQLGLTPLVRKLGIVPANPGEAAAALRSGAKVLVFPGGDIDSLRPWSKRKELCFDGRKGYARLAREVGVPIVPVVNAGGHEGFVVLHQGREMARRLGLVKWLKYNGFPVTLALPWGLCIGPAGYLPYVPLPAKVTVEFGEAVEPAAYDDADGLAAAVEARMSARLTALYAERRWPVVG